MLTSALTSLMVYWAALVNTIAGPLPFASLRVWLASNVLLYVMFFAAVVCSSVWCSPLPVYVLLAASNALVLLGLLYFGGSIIRQLQAMPSAGKTLLHRLLFLVRNTLPDSTRVIYAR